MLGPTCSAALRGSEIRQPMRLMTGRGMFWEASLWIFRRRPCFPFDRPALPFLSWARRAGAGHVSPLGLNIHSTYGLWHAYRAALLFSVTFDIPPQSAGAHPCQTCADKPCISSCPVGAFSGTSYAVDKCASHVGSPAGLDCLDSGCLARRACPVGQGFTYHPYQAQFFMRAFIEARRNV